MNKKWKVVLLTGLSSLCLGLPVSAATTGTTNATVTVLGGSLGLTSPNPTVNIGSIALDGTTKNLTANLGTMAVQDLTGSGSGWNVTVSATQFTADTHTIPKNSLSLKGIDSVTSDGTASTAPSAVSGALTIDSGTAQKILTATQGTGMGKYNVNFVKDALQLTVPADTYASTNSPYSSTITYTIVTGP
ncbi:WxL domain-containing protein [Neobacillus vireti]|uniref:WxL domain-containing protein n=1 Tax=Neobacillus vireti TaxID=220686 RepID=UPI0030005F20